MSASEQPSVFRSSAKEAKSFDKITTKGRPDGLFQACMKTIRTAHFRSNRVRAVLVIGGLLTDKKIYLDIISIFYAVTKELEAKLHALKDKDAICQNLLALGYHFTEQYEKDLAFLYGTDDWKEQVEAVVQNTVAAVDYRNKIRTMMTGTELAGAALVLWGALIIGGGAAAMPRVKSRYGAEATHLFQDVTGPGREQRKSDFIQTWDTLAQPGDDKSFDVIVRLSQECMQCNNNVLSSLARNPWWLSYVVAGGVAVLSIGAAILIQRRWIK